MLASRPVVQLVEALHESPAKLSINICGAGVAALSAMTSVAGCSRTLLQGDVLYSSASTAAALDYMPSSFVSAATARHLAQHAYHTSVRLLQSDQGKVGGEPVLLLGVGATSAVQTSRQRRGLDQAFVSVWGSSPHTAPSGGAAGSGTGIAILDAHLLLKPDSPRAEQDEQVALLLLHTIGQFVAAAQGSDTGKDAWSLASALCGEATMQWCAIPTSPPSTTATAATATASVQSACLAREAETAVAIRSVLDGTSPVAIFNKYGEARAQAAPLLFPEGEPTPTDRAERRPIRLLYPGSFRPLHWGHTELAREALRVCHEHFQGRRSNQDDLAPSSLPPPPLDELAHVTYEIAAKIVDKGAVSAAALAARVAQFTRRGERVAVSGATLFVEKAALFPGHGFIVGIDTASRILDPKYYQGGDEAGMVAALTREIGARGCYFVVGGRAVAAGPDGETTWEDMSTLAVPEGLKGLFISVPEERFRVDISSTELRARQKRTTL